MKIYPVTKHTFSDFTTLWEQAFGDSPEIVQGILDCLGDDQQSFVLEDNGQICSALTQFYMGDLILPADPSCGPLPFSPLPVLVSYAISTDPKARDKGYGSAITTFAQKEAGRQGAPSMLSPAEPDLIDFYEPLGYRPLFAAVTDTIPLSSEKTAFDAESAPEFSPVRLTPELYFTLREQFLASVPHVRLSRAAQRFAEWCCSEGGFFLFEEENILLAVEKGANGSIAIPELLVSSDKLSDPKSDERFPSGFGKAAAWLTRLCSEQQKEVPFSSPAFSGSCTAAVQAMISFEGLPDSSRQAAEEILLHANRPESSGYAPYFGFTFG